MSDVVLPDFDLPDFDLPDSVDLLVVGSGPAGATFARIVHDQLPDARILMVDVGPRLTEQAGQNTRNLPLDARKQAQARSQGPRGANRSAAPNGQLDGFVAARPGTFLISDRRTPVADPATGTIDDGTQTGMPAAAMSSDVGGMSAHWTCACPPPGGTERNPHLSEKEFDAAFARAGELLSVTTAGFRPTATSSRVLERLGALYDAGREPDRAVQPMPLACLPRESGLPFWSGSDQVLGPLAVPGGGEPQFLLSAETLCRRLIMSDDRFDDGLADGGTDGGPARVIAVELEHLPSGRRRTVGVRAVAVAADTFRTPQLLWASGVRPAALGRYLNDQPQIIASVLVDQAATPDDPLVRAQDPADPRDQLTGVLWVPFVDGSHPFHGQVMQLDASPITIGDGDPAGPVIGMGWFSRKQVRAQDRVVFSADRTDGYGMPAMTIHYQLTDADRATIAAATAALREAAQAVGRFPAGGEPRLLPAGSSMHYQGTVRMGAEDDGTSVCDVSSRVWGTGNLFVGGNGVIPTATACNPTATSVAMAIIAAESIVDLLSTQRSELP